MSSKSQPPSKKAKSQEAKGFSTEGHSEKSRLPFEPAQAGKKSSKKAKAAPAVKTTSSQQQSGPTSKSSQQHAIAAKAFTGIPEVVSKRMSRRMAAFCGIPTGLGMLTFIVSYLIVSQHLFKLPTVAVLLVSLGFFGLGVLGLSYGALSASWDEDRIGTWLGWSEFRTNFGRTVKSWRSTRQNPS